MILKKLGLLHNISGKKGITLENRWYKMALKTPGILYFPSLMWVLLFTLSTSFLTNHAGHHHLMNLQMPRMPNIKKIILLLTSSFLFSRLHLSSRISFPFSLPRANNSSVLVFNSVLSHEFWLSSNSFSCSKRFSRY